MISSKLQWSFQVLRLKKELLSTLQPLSSCWCKTHLNLDTDSCLPAERDLSFVSFSDPNILTIFFSAAGNSWCFLPDSSSDMTVPCTLYLNTVVWTVDLGTCNCFEMAPRDFPDLFKTIMGSFRSMLSSLDFSIVVFVYESNGCIKQDPIRMGPEKCWAVINQNHSEEVKRSCYKEHTIYTTFYNHHNWSFKLMHVCIWSSRFVIFSYNNFIIEPNFMKVFLWQSSLCSTHSSQKHESYRNHLKWRLPWYRCSLRVDVLLAKTVPLPKPNSPL